MNDLFLQHSNICKLVSLLIKHHTTTLCKHVPTVEMIIKCKNLSMIFFSFYHWFCFSTSSICCLSSKRKETTRRKSYCSCTWFNKVFIFVIKFVVLLSFFIDYRLILLNNVKRIFAQRLFMFLLIMFSLYLKELWFLLRLK